MTRRLALLLGMSALSACSMEPHYERPAAPVPASFPAGDPYLLQTEANLPAVRYQDLFTDARVQQLVTQALANNRDLRIAAANIASARAQYKIQRADLLPEIDAGGRFNVGDTGTSTGGQGGVDTSFNANIGVTAFEIDLFGRVRSLTHAALDQYFATEAAGRGTRLTLVGDIATAWLNYAADKSLLKIAEETAKSAQVSVRLTNARLQGGVAPRTDLRQAEIVLHQAESDLEESRTQLAQDVNALQLLVGAPIDTALLPDSIESVVDSFKPLPAGLSSDVLLRRPDVVQAEYQLRAANAEIGAARAALFPKLSLTGLAGFASNALFALFDRGTFAWSVAPQISYPLFRAGAGRAGVAQSEAQRDAALATWEKAVQTAFRETADALARRGTIADQEKAQIALVTSSADNFRLSEARYRGGIDTYLASLLAQRSLYTAQRSLVQTRLMRATNLVTLYKVLGGDSQLDATADGPKELSPQQ